MANSVISFVAGMPIPILDQMILRVSSKYPLSFIKQSEIVKNGIKQVFYKDFKEAGNKKGYDDVVIGDFNPTNYVKFTEIYKADVHLSASMPLWNSALNDITLTPGLFMALVNDIEKGIIKPMAKAMFSRLITAIDKDSFYDEVLSFTAAPADSTAKEEATLKAKEIYSKLIDLKMPSRLHLKKKPTGATEGLEYVADTSKMILIFNKLYAANYVYDLSSGVFQANEIKLKVGKILELNLDMLEKYSKIKVGDQKLKDYQVILIDKGIYHEIIHYQAAKIVNTPKLKEALTRYDRIGSFRRKDKIAIAWK